MTAVDLRQEAVPLVRETFSEFQRHNSQWLAAAIAYFTLFSIAPLVIVIVEIAGFALGQHQQALNMLYGYLGHTARAQAADVIRSIVQSTFSHTNGGTFTQIIGWVFFILGAIGLFSAFQQALNTVWDVPQKKTGLIEMVRMRLVSFGIVLVVAILLLVSLFINSAVMTAEQALAHLAPFAPGLAKGIDYVVSAAIIAGLFAVIFEYLPDRRIAWRDVWPGAIASAVLFVIGQALLSWYLGYAGLSSSFGIFGGIVAFLLWANYSAQIVLFGAEFTHVYARRRGNVTRSSVGEVRTGSPQDRSQSRQSMPGTSAPR
jgi:membrane protein